MPQIAPMMWLYLFFIFLSLFTLVFVKTFYLK